MRGTFFMAAAVGLSIAVTGCGGRQRDEQRVEVEVAQTGDTSGGQIAQPTGQIVYAVGVPQEGHPAPPDLVAEHMQARYGQYASDMIPTSPLYHGNLGQGQEERFQTVLEAGFCYRVIGVGGPTMSDLDLWIVDENGNEIARDVATDNFPVLGVQQPICPRWTGPFFVRALAYSGYGEYGLQVFRSP